MYVTVCEEAKETCFNQSISKVDLAEEENVKTLGQGQCIKYCGLPDKIAVQVKRGSCTLAQPHQNYS